jgi:hypothetical protein
MTRILEFTTEAAANACAADIDAQAVGYWADLGFTITDGELVPKNAATGLDDPLAQRTVRWSAPALSPEGTWWIVSLVGTPYENAMTGLRERHTFTERDMPAWGSGP